MALFQSIIEKKNVSLSKTSYGAHNVNVIGNTGKIVSVSN